MSPNVSRCNRSVSVATSYILAVNSTTIQLTFHSAPQIFVHNYHAPIKDITLFTAMIGLSVVPLFSSHVHDEGGLHFD